MSSVLGVVSWDDPTSTDIKTVSSAFSKALPTLTPFIFSHITSFRQVTVSKVDIGIWTVGRETMVLATNMNYEDVQVRWSDVGLSWGKIREVYAAEASTNSEGMRFGSVGSGAWILN